jgi:trimethylamine:corrinoid methyltransferase-like protein
METSMNRELLIEKRAYEIWESEGRPDGREQEHWHKAVREVEAKSLEPVVSDAGAPTAAPKKSRPGRKKLKPSPATVA